MRRRGRRCRTDWPATARLAGARPRETPLAVGGADFRSGRTADAAKPCPQGERRYRYYVSRELILRSVEAGATGWRIPAQEVETATAQAIVAKLRDPAFASGALASGQRRANSGMRLVTALRRIEAELRDLDSEAGKVMLRQIVLRVDVNEWRASKAPATISEIAQRHGADVADVSREMQPAFLAPSLVEQILDGRQPAALTANRLRRIGDLPLLWDEQAEALG